MFLRFTIRKKNGKEHRYYSLVENRRVSSGRVVQRPVLYLGEINDNQQEAWRKTTLALEYKGCPLQSKFAPDFMCYDKIIVELKAVTELIDEHRAQVQNYLKA